jgi:hypothetical protein
MTNEWVYPGAIVWWYYALYHAVRSMLAAFDGREPDTHRDVVASTNELTDKLPHPFNMVAAHGSGEEYSVTLPNYSHARRHDLITRFDGTRSAAQGILLTYLNGTAGWVVGNVKDRLKQQHNLQDFRTTRARQLRDERLPVKVNILNCVYRFRGKANYRDGLFLSYGDPHNWLTPSFLSDLFTIASFGFVCAFAYAERRIGRNFAADFLNDSRTYFRGLDSTVGVECFWTSF